MLVVARDHQEDVPADIHPVAPGRNAGSGDLSAFVDVVADERGGESEGGETSVFTSTRGPSSSDKNACRGWTQSEPLPTICS